MEKRKEAAKVLRKASDELPLHALARLVGFAEGYSFAEKTKKTNEKKERS